jgi:hypothetical protein
MSRRTRTGKTFHRARGQQQSNLPPQPSKQEKELHEKIMGIGRDVFVAAAGKMLADGEQNEDEYSSVARESVDIALVYAREVLGIQAQRSRPIQPQSDAPVPQPIIED